jgi:hypothetical protein
LPNRALFFLCVPRAFQSRSNEECFLHFNLLEFDGPGVSFFTNSRRCQLAPRQRLGLN